MPLTRDVKETIRARIKRDPEFGEELLKEESNACLRGKWIPAISCSAITSPHHNLLPQARQRVCRVARGIS